MAKDNTNYVIDIGPLPSLEVEGSDARFPVMAGALSMLLVLAGGSWLLGVVLGWGLPGVWIAYAADEWIRGLIMWRRWQTHAWVPHAKASRKRLRPAIVVEG